MRIVPESTTRGTVYQRSNLPGFMDGSTSGRVATDYHWLAYLYFDPWVGFIGWRPIIGADYSPVAIMELTSEDAALLIASENVYLELKREWSEVQEINQFRGQYGEYHSLFPQLKADGERFFQILEWLLKRSPTFWGKFNTAWSRIGVTFINRRFCQKNVL